MIPGRNGHFSLGAVESTPEQLSLGLEPAKPAGVSFLRYGARRYAQQQGLSYSAEGLDQMQADPTMQSRIARGYESATSAPNDVRLRGAYNALRHEVGQQYDYLTKPRTAGGLGVNVSFEPENPDKPIYPTYGHLMTDIQQNRRLRVAQTGSQGDEPNSLMPPEDNDKFRAVHDAFGHAAIGRSFTRHGEEAAYHSHMQMFSPEARPALALETRAQNSTLNFGKNAGTFPEQKAYRIPDWATRSRI